MTEFPETRSTLLVSVKSPENRRAWDEFVDIYRPVVYRMARRRGHPGCRCSGEALDLNSLAALDAETARQLSSAQCQQRLSLNGLKAITPEVVTILASGNYSLELQRLTVRDVATRRALDSATVKLRAAGRELVWGAPLEEELRLGTEQNSTDE